MMRDESPRFSRPVSVVMAVPVQPVLQPSAPSPHQPQGQVLRGRYAAPLRSAKGKIKGLILHAAEGELAIKLPKYLRPMLVRELGQRDHLSSMNSQSIATGGRYRKGRLSSLHHHR